MRILINTAHQRFGGAVQVALSVIQECRKFKEHDFIIWIGPGLKENIYKDEYPDNFVFKNFNFGKISLATTNRINHLLQEQEKVFAPDIIISTSGPSYFKSKAPQIIGFNLPLYIYPDSPYFGIISLKEKLKIKIKKFVHQYYFRRDASAYIVQTDDVNYRAKAFLKNSNINTITNSHSGYYYGWKKFPDFLPPKKPGTIRCLTISSYYKHKNLDIIPDIIKLLFKLQVFNVEFVVTLPNRIFIEHFGGIDNLINVGPVKPKECPSLYSECDIMFLPTLAECFSASYPEAMIMKKPIVTTNLSFAREICGPAALYFEPLNAKSAAEKINILVKSTAIKEKLINNGLNRLKNFDTPSTRAIKIIKLAERIYKSVKQ